MNGLVKLNLACGDNPFGHEWFNVDIRTDTRCMCADNYILADLKNGIPANTSSVDIIYISHFLEHLDPFDGCKAFLDECFRVMKPKGLLRISVPDFRKVALIYLDDPKCFYAEYGNKKQWFDKVKTWNRRIGISVMYGHKMIYDIVSLTEVLEDSGFSQITPVHTWNQGLLPCNIVDEMIPTHVSHSLVVDSQK